MPEFLSYVSSFLTGFSLSHICKTEYIPAPFFNHIHGGFIDEIRLKIRIGNRLIGVEAVSAKEVQLAPVFKASILLTEVSLAFILINKLVLYF